jgi:3-hydroxy-9,10-secoandrosta-1,3,5(10)-triene-9,17-dione monooxygenase reductase component
MSGRSVVQVSERIESTPFPPVTAEAMREVLGSFCSGLVVVTAQSDVPFGFTCQTFTSLSLEPPLVSFSPAKTSTTWPRIRDVGTFCVNVLADDHQHLSAQFARSGTDKFAGVSWSPSPAGAPLLDGVVAWVDCRLREEHDGGDHTIVIGEVLGLGAAIDRHPLLFFRGTYRQHGPLASTATVVERSALPRLPSRSVARLGETTMFPDAIRVLGLKDEQRLLKIFNGGGYELC